MSNVVSSEKKDGICILTLNRPEKLNAINEAMIRELRDAMAEANQDNSVLVVILRGAGSAFCSGDDLVATAAESQKPFDAAHQEYLLNTLQDVSREMVMGDKFVIGAIHGWAVGAGFEWAINCDFSIWAEGAKGFFPEIRWGLFPSGGVTTLLAKITGPQKARELLLFGEKHDARQLHELGIAWRVVPESRLMEEALAVAGQIAALPPHAVRQLKRTVNRACCHDLEAALQAETEALATTINHPATATLLREFTDGN